MAWRPVCRCTSHWQANQPYDAISVVTLLAAYMLTSMCWPSPVSSRASSATSRDITAQLPAVWNAWLPPPRTGGNVWSSYPQLHDRARLGHHREVGDRLAANAPIALPNGVIDTITRRGLSGRDGVPTEPERVEHARRLALDQHVGVGEQRRDPLAVPDEVGDDAALGRVVVPPPQAPLGPGDVVDERLERALRRSAGRLDDDARRRRDRRPACRPRRRARGSAR